MIVIPKRTSVSIPQEVNEAVAHELAGTVRPIQKKPGKKGKKFANQDLMLRVLHESNSLLEEGIKKKLDRETEILKVIARRSKVSRTNKKETRSQKVANVKDSLRNKVQSKGKGDHRKIGSDSQKDTTIRKTGKADRKKVSFK